MEDYFIGSLKQRLLLSQLIHLALQFLYTVLQTGIVEPKQV